MNLSEEIELLGKLITPIIAGTGIFMFFIKRHYGKKHDDAKIANIEADTALKMQDLYKKDRKELLVKFGELKKQIEGYVDLINKLRKDINKLAIGLSEKDLTIAKLKEALNEKL